MSHGFEPLVLRHYSAAPLIPPVRSYAQEKPDMKPKGFWVSADNFLDDSWPAWCKSEDFNLQGLKVAHDVTIAPTAKILWLRKPHELDAFTERYHVDFLKGLVSSRMFIDWWRVAEEYQGILIAPYIWARRLDGDCPWYYGWDCASGCIWDATAIAEVRQCTSASLAPETE